MSAIVSLRDVVKTYTRGKQSVEVLHRLNLAVAEGDFVALMARRARARRRCSI